MHKPGALLGHEGSQTSGVATSTLFERVWSNLLAEKGLTALVFPRKILWLNGAPGSGKGTHTPLILQKMGFKQAPVVISDLLQTPAARELMAAGILVGDEEVTGLLLRKLLEPAYAEGVAIDGYPRTIAQAEFVKAFFDAMQALHARDGGHFPMPEFSVLVLMVDEATSVKRQLHRGQVALAHRQSSNDNKNAVAEEVRPTDLDPEKALKRYRIFSESTFAALKTLEGTFPYAEVDAAGLIEAVAKNVELATERL